MLAGRLSPGSGNDSLLAGYDDSWSSRLPSPQLSYIAIGHNMAEGEGFQLGRQRSEPGRDRPGAGGH